MNSLTSGNEIAFDSTYRCLCNHLDLEFTGYNTDLISCSTLLTNSQVVMDAELTINSMGNKWIVQYFWACKQALCWTKEAYEEIH